MLKKIKNFIDNKGRNKIYEKIFAKYHLHTMIPKSSYIATLKLIENHYSEGDIVECGVWKGGMIAGIAELIGESKGDFYLFDSFEGLPPAKEIDGEAAIHWQSNKESKNYYNNCKADEEDAKYAMKLANISNYHIIKGWFEDTLTNFTSNNSIQILHLDADWYESIYICLKKLYPLVKEEGLIIIDDYYVWEGTSRAVHDYLSLIRSKSRIYTLTGGIAYLIKKDSDV